MHIIKTIIIPLYLHNTIIYNCISVTKLIVNIQKIHVVKINDLKDVKKIAIKIRQIKLLLEEIEREYSSIETSKNVKVVKMKNEPSAIFLETVNAICSRKKIKIN